MTNVQMYQCFGYYFFYDTEFTQQNYVSLYFFLFPLFSKPL